MKKNKLQRIFITGASSGIGLKASQCLALAGHHLTLPCRSLERSKQTLDQLTTAGADPNKLETITMDMSDLDSVLRSCNQLLNRGEAFDGIILNAGLQSAGIKQPLFSKQGIELTIAVNHLAHQLISTRLLPLLLKGDQPRLIITASEVHNPSTGGGRVGRPAGLKSMNGLKQGAGFTMIDGVSSFDADKAYKDSKLCNLLMAKELHRQLQASNQSIPVVSWSPGLVIPRNSQGFFRTSRRQNPIGFALFALLARDLFRVTESLDQAGVLLSKLAIDPQFSEPDFNYYSNRLLRPGRHLFDKTQPSQEASDPNKAAELWSLSEALINATLRQ
tara:strand:- start:825 stop:1820 length:996 start_codon:yes stop_codon:yes gene_type:complete